MGHQRNKYDWCVMNNIVNGKICTILWNVYDLKMSHVDYGIFSSVLADIDAEYGNIEKITTTRGNIKKYPAMTIDLSSTGKLIFSMVYCIGKMINDTPEYMRGK